MKIMWWAFGFYPNWLNVTMDFMVISGLIGAGIFGIGLLIWTIRGI